MELLLQACKSGHPTPETVKAAIEHYFRDAGDASRLLVLVTLLSRYLTFLQPSYQLVVGIQSFARAFSPIP